MFPPAVKKLIDLFIRLPGVGPKTAERFALHLLKSGRGDVARLQKALEELLQTVRSCELCHTFSDTSPCAICADSRRNHGLVCVVAEPTDTEAIEKTRAFTGVYHVLRGLVTPLDDPDSAKIKLNGLYERLLIKPPAEIIFALDPTIDGETTVQYIMETINPVETVCTRLAIGLPAGGSVEYADETTLTSALRGRRQV